MTKYAFNFSDFGGDTVLEAEIKTTPKTVVESAQNDEIEPNLATESKEETQASLPKDDEQAYAPPPPKTTGEIYVEKKQKNEIKILGLSSKEITIIGGILAIIVLFFWAIRKK